MTAMRVVPPPADREGRTQWSVRFILRNGSTDTRFAWAGALEPQAAIDHCCQQAGYSGSNDPRIQTIEVRNMNYAEQGSKKETPAQGTLEIDQEIEWRAHVVMQHGTVMEVAVKAKAWDRTGAMAKAYTKLGLTGPDDERVKTMLVEPANVPIKLPKREENLRAAKLNGPRFRVELYPTYMSGTPRIQNGRAKTAEDMLWSVAQMCSVKKIEDTGPYLVQEYTDKGLITRLVKYPTTFPDAGKIGEPSKSEQSKLLQQSTDLVWCPVVRQYISEREADLNAAFSERSLTEQGDWEGDGWENWPYGGGATRTGYTSRKDSLVQKVSDLLDKEIKVLKPVYKVEVK